VMAEGRGLRAQIVAQQHKSMSRLPRVFACTPGFRAPGSGHTRVPGSGLRAPGSGFRVPGSGLRAPGAGFRVPGSGFRVSGFGLRVSDFGFRVLSFGYRACLHVPRLDLENLGSSLLVWLHDLREAGPSVPRFWGYNPV